MAAPEDGIDQTAAGLAPAAEASDGASASTDKRKQGALDSLFDRLDIAEEEFDDFVIEDDSEIAESVRWLAVARVVYQKKFSHAAFLHQMQIAWNPAREVTLRAVGDNLFVIQCFCLSDWEKVMLRGPWLFRDWSIVLAEYDGMSDPASVALNIIPLWLHVLKLPSAYRRNILWRS
jgi:hypothetical protein